MSIPTHDTALICRKIRYWAVNTSARNATLRSIAPRRAGTISLPASLGRQRLIASPTISGNTCPNTSVRDMRDVERQRLVAGERPREEAKQRGDSSADDATRMTISPAAVLALPLAMAV